VFEGFDTSNEINRALVGGGRYDSYIPHPRKKGGFLD